MKTILSITTIILSLLLTQVRSQCNSTEPNQTFGTAITIPVGDPPELRTICSGDSHYFILSNTNATFLAGQTSYIVTQILSDTVNGNHTFYDLSKVSFPKTRDILNPLEERFILQMASGITSYYMIINWPNSFWTNYGAPSMDYTITTNSLTCTNDYAGSTQNTAFELSYYFDATDTFRTVDIPVQICGFKQRWYKVKVPSFGAISASFGIGLPTDVGYRINVTNGVTTLNSCINCQINPILNNGVNSGYYYFGVIPLSANSSNQFVNGFVNGNYLTTMSLSLQILPCQDGQYRCDNGLCTSDILQCRPNITCSANSVLARFPCVVGDCVSVFGQCRSRINCTAGEKQCWNGMCVQNLSNCPTVPACPISNPVRCRNGACANLAINCGSNICSGYVCPDGNCVANRSECGLYNGCSLESPNQCPDGRCGTLLGECECSAGSYRCWNGTCTSDKSQCRTPPFQVKLPEISFHMDNTVNNRISILDPTYSREYCTISIATGTFTTPDTLIEISPLPDSALVNTNFSNWDTPYSSNIFTPILKIQSDGEEVVLQRSYTITCEAEFNGALELQTDICLAWLNLTTMEWTCADNDLTLAVNRFGVVIIAGDIDRLGVLSFIQGFDLPPPPGASSSSGGKGSNVLGIAIGVGITGVILVGVLVVVIIFLLKKRKGKDRKAKKMASSLSVYGWGEDTASKQWQDF